MASGVGAAANNLRVALFTPSSVACADKTTATKNVKSFTDSNSPLGSGLASWKRRNISSTVVCGNLRMVGGMFQLELNVGVPSSCRACKKASHNANGTSILTPHRALNREGFIALMSILILVNFVGGVLFLAVGAWPVTGFMGLDVLLMWWAIRVNYADARQAERISVAGDVVTLQRHSEIGGLETLEFNRRWLRVELEFDEAREIGGAPPVVLPWCHNGSGGVLGCRRTSVLVQGIKTSAVINRVAIGPALP